jgi:transcriptional regulator with XRE-family HTH domain
MRRLVLEMSQTTLGNALGLTFQQVQKYERGTNRISASRLQQISHILQVPVSFFFEGAPGPPGPSRKKCGAVAELRQRLFGHFGWACAHESIHADQGPEAPAARRSSRPRNCDLHKKCQNVAIIGDIALRLGRLERAGARLYMRQAQYHRCLKVRQCLRKSPRKRSLPEQRRLSTAASTGEAKMTEKICPECNGEGVVDQGTEDERRCPTCNGSGIVPDEGQGSEEVWNTHPERAMSAGVIGGLDSD